MEFEYDSLKSESNLAKHGIDFDEACSLWDDEGLVTFDIAYGGEKRCGAIGRIGGELWTAIYTVRGARIRIISVRRSAAKEVSRYDRAQNER